MFSLFLSPSVTMTTTIDDDDHDDDEEEKEEKLEDRESYAQTLG